MTELHFNLYILYMAEKRDINHPPEQRLLGINFTALRTEAHENDGGFFYTLHHYNYEEIPVRLRQRLIYFCTENLLNSN